jgi:hypothetical protein
MLARCLCFNGFEKHLRAASWGGFHPHGVVSHSLRNGGGAKRAAASDFCNSQASGSQLGHSRKGRGQAFGQGSMPPTHASSARVNHLPLGEK